MPRTKTRQRPAPRRARTRPREISTPIPGHAQGAKACIVMRRRGQLWSVTDAFRGKPAYVGAAEMWHELKPETDASELYRWTEAQARALVAHFVEQAVDIARNNSALDVAAEAAETARRLEELAARMVPQQVVPEVVNLQYMGEQLRKAAAEVAAARAKRSAPAEERTFTVPAAMDQPDYQPPKPDPAPDRRLLSRKAMDIPANCDDETVGLPLLRIHGPEVTAVLPVVAPPMPTVPPTVHLDEVHRRAGSGARRSVADAMAAPA